MQTATAAIADTTSITTNASNFSTGTTTAIGQALIEAACTRYHGLLLILILQLQLLYTITGDRS